MNTKASSNLCNTYKLLHKFRLFSLQLGKLVHYYKQMWYRKFYLTGFYKLGIIINIVHSGLIEDSLSSHILALYGHHSSLYRTS